ncbi:MAG: cupin domain-containing protein [Pseudomonadota bacterium]|nr:cupin domain-containing protein [Pseudomonadota bacterium]
MTDKPSDPFRAFAGFRWDGVTLLPYKEDGAAPFKAVTRQVLFHDPDLKCELRYFEVAPGGHSTLERHEHVHGVMILRGAAEVLVGSDVRNVKAFDLVHIPPLTWHQFRTTGREPMGFLCMVNAERDRPQLPNDADLADLRAHPAVAAFLTAK